MKISLRVFLYEGSSYVAVSLKLTLDQIWKWEWRSSTQGDCFLYLFAHFQRIFRTLYSYNLADKYLFKLNSENAGTTTLFIVEFGQVFTQRETEIHLIIVFIYSFFSPSNGYRRPYSLHLFFFFFHRAMNIGGRIVFIYSFFFTKQWISESV